MFSPFREGEEFATKIMNQALMEQNFSPITSIFYDETANVVKYREMFLLVLGSLSERSSPAGSIKNVDLNFREINGVITVQLPQDFVAFQKIERTIVLEDGYTIHSKIDGIYTEFSSNRLILHLDRCTQYTERSDVALVDFFSNCQFWYRGLPLLEGDVLPTFKIALIDALKVRLTSSYDPNLLISERERSIAIAKNSDGYNRNNKVNTDDDPYCRPKIPFSSDWSI